MPNSDTELPQVYLRPGEFFLAHEHTVIRTILGSCVGVTLWSKRLGVGALCHSMLPICPSQTSAIVPPEIGYRYVDFCIRDLARKFDELGASRAELQVKLFGGADVLCTGQARLAPTVGRQNFETAIKVLRSEGFHSVAASALGKTFGRKIRFNTKNGDVLVRRLI